MSSMRQLWRLNSPHNENQYTVLKRSSIFSSFLKEICHKTYSCKKQCNSFPVLLHVSIGDARPRRSDATGDTHSETLMTDNSSSSGLSFAESSLSFTDENNLEGIALKLLIFNRCRPVLHGMPSYV